MADRRTAAALTELDLELADGAVPYMLLGLLRSVVERTVAARDLSRALDALLRTDLALKTSGGDPRVLLERLIVELCATGGSDGLRRGRGRRPAPTSPSPCCSRFCIRDLYRAAALSWMMPLPAILSMSDTVSGNCPLAPSTSLASERPRGWTSGRCGASNGTRGSFRGASRSGGAPSARMHDWPRVSSPPDSMRPGLSARHETLIIAQVFAADDPYWAGGDGRKLWRTNRRPSEPERTPSAQPPSRDVNALLAAMQSRRPPVAAHCRRVSAYGVQLATQYGLPEATVDTIRVGGLLHDLGKAMVPAQILSKPGRLTEGEWRALQAHPEDGFEMVEPLGFDARLLEIILYHHERIDGSGYPDGLDGASIPWTVRIVSVMDAFDALTSPRAYRERAVDRRRAHAAGARGGRPLLPVGRQRPAVDPAPGARSRRARRDMTSTSPTRGRARRCWPAPPAWPFSRWSAADAVATATRTSAVRGEFDNLPSQPWHQLAGVEFVPIAFPRTMPRMIAVEGLTKVYGGLKAVDDLSFSVAGGEVVGLIGPNGAGKTTTLEVRGGHPGADAGTVRIDGHDIVADADRGEAPAGVHARRAAAVRVPDRRRAPAPGRAAVRRRRRRARVPRRCSASWS